MQENAMKRARLLAGMSLQDVGDKMHIHPNTVWNWEHGKSYPTVDKFIAYCKVVGCDPGDILLPKESTES